MTRCLRPWIIRTALTGAGPLVSTGKSLSPRPVSEITASVQLAACTSIPMQRLIGAFLSRRAVSYSRFEGVQRGIEAPSFAGSMVISCRARASG